MASEQGSRVAEAETGPAMGMMRASSGAALNTARISMRGLDFYYGANKALKGIQLDLPAKQVTGMIGPSGCGKSTLLRVLNRMYRPLPRPARRGGGDDGRPEHYRT